MNIDLITDDRLRESSVIARVGHRELRNHLDPARILIEVRSAIAQKLADLVMAKIGPVIEDALGGLEKD